MTTITAFGMTWNLKDGIDINPGPNSYNSTQNVWLDEYGFLHLKITNDGGTWNCAEVTSQDTLSFGTYQWHINTRTDLLDKNVVLSFGGNRGISLQDEIDTQFSKFGSDIGNNALNTVYPNVSGYTKTTHSYPYSLTSAFHTVRYKWISTRTTFLIMNGLQVPNSTIGLIHQWNYAPSMPSRYIPQESMPVVIGLYLFNGVPPSNSEEVEVVVQSFTKTA